MKYRCLTYQEFEVMESDFSDFLHKLGFNFFEWGILQDQDSYTASNLLKKYSELAFDKVMKKIDCLQYRTPAMISTIYFKQNKYVKIEIKQEKGPLLDLTQPSSLAQLELPLIRPFRIKKSIKHYMQNREETIFNLIEAGFYVVPKETFFQFDSLRQVMQN